MIINEYNIKLMIASSLLKGWQGSKINEREITPDIITIKLVDGKIIAAIEQVIINEYNIKLMITSSLLKGWQGSKINENETTPDMINLKIVDGKVMAVISEE